MISPIAPVSKAEFRIARLPSKFANSVLAIAVGRCEIGLQAHISIEEPLRGLLRIFKVRKDFSSLCQQEVCKTTIRVLFASLSTFTPSRRLFVSLLLRANFPGILAVHTSPNSNLGPLGNCPECNDPTFRNIRMDSPKWMTFWFYCFRSLPQHRAMTSSPRQSDY